jgi:ribonuclease HI
MMYNVMKFANKIDSTKISTIELYTDNKSVIKRLNLRRQLKRTVNQRKDADYNIEQQILQEIKQLMAVRILVIQITKDNCSDDFLL